MLVCTVIGFPLGATTPEVKAWEARKALRDGAREVDMVINVGALKSGDSELVLADIERVVDAAHEVGALCKVWRRALAVGACREADAMQWRGATPSHALDRARGSPTCARRAPRARGRDAPFFA